METTVAELLVLAVAVAAVYRLAAPVRRRVENWILGILDPGRPRVIDVTPEKPGPPRPGGKPVNHKE